MGVALLWRYCGVIVALLNAIINQCCSKKNREKEQKTLSIERKYVSKKQCVCVCVYVGGSGWLTLDDLNFAGVCRFDA